ncbi:hypothetical protein KO494_07260 [Lacinutrix sp. C3R15]|uniref:hypothetical protein n=1 Tax=Flavobacteriaceae TaxID=49546 RepID=UPI001C0975C7|nr:MULTISPECIES: hypothetical protein [Flavobacteriaceae]MBU2939334.1 hypothetical protein [Lacinutrix sp. C3R15]MDO6622649.1 hypothetical protein [Oceanihabitans sp. 1_MG-2023]
MRIVKDFFDFYINASIHVALSVCALTWITLFEFDISQETTVLYFNFFATITGYNFVKYFGLAKFHHRSLANKLKVIQVFSFFCFLALCYYAFQLEIKTWVYILILGVITFFYAIPFLPRNVFVDNNQNLRQISGLKIYVIALVWSVATVLLPLVDNAFLLNADVFITVLQRFILVLVLMIPFEIRDLQFDSLKLSTIPQSIGIRKTKVIGFVLLVVFFFLEFFKDQTSSVNVFVLALFALITCLFVLFSKKNQAQYYSSFFVEGLPILWLVLLLMYGFF